jgi:hypothetical protein
MNILTTAVPQWVSILFLLSFTAPVFMISRAIKQGSGNSNFSNNKVSQLTKGTILFFAAFYIYTALMSFTGIFQENSLPPKILLFTTLPLLLFYFLFIFRTNTYWTILEKVKLSALVRIHIFRFAGIFFLLAWYYDALPKYFAFAAGFGDIFAALTAILVARLIDSKNKQYKKITLIWNIIGFWDIVNVLAMAIYLTKQSIETGSKGILEMVNFPFCLIPAFAPATIIFLHISIFKKLKMEK